MNKGVWIALAVFGCGPQEVEDTNVGPVDTDTDTDIVDTDTDTDSDTDSDTDTGPDPCLEAPPSGPRNVQTIAIATEEDFDFDADGWLVYQGQGGILAVKPGGQQEVIAPAFGGDPSGIQILSTGNVVTLDRALGTLRTVVRASGQGTLLLSNLSGPNGVEVESTDRVYMTEPGPGRVSWYDFASGQTGAVTGQLSLPNNLVLSNDEQTLYVATLNGIAEISRNGPDSWNATPTRTIGEGLGNILTVEIDECDNLYTVQNNRMYRIFSDGTGYEQIAEIPIGGFPSSIRWGNGVGDFQRETLYVTMRSVIHAVDVGVRGKKHPTSP